MCDDKHCTAHTSIYKYCKIHTSLFVRACVEYMIRTRNPVTISTASSTRSTSDGVQ